MAALHHPAIIEKYDLRHLISCESANTCADMVEIIGSHLGLEPSNLLSKRILQHLAQRGSCLIVLDNFETPWEPIESRGQVEDFLSLLADITSLALLAWKVKWNRPFLVPLEPLSPSASRQIFVEVADEPGNEDKSALDDLLDLSGSLPLAVSLMANVASVEGYSGTLARWERENTALLSEGHDKRSNLEQSISFSVNSPRISLFPNAKQLISLLSLLPDGIMPEEMMTARIPLPDVRHCQSVLVGTSLAYVDVKGRLKALSPVREYIRRSYPPSAALARPLRTYFQDLLEVWRSKHDLPSGNLVPDLVSHLGNINQLILAGLLTEGKSACIEMGKSIITLEFFSGMMLKGGSPLFNKLPGLIEETDDAALRWRYRARILRNSFYYLVPDPESWIEEGVQYFDAGTAPVRQGVNFYNAVARHYIARRYWNISKAAEFSKWAFTLAQKTNDTNLQWEALETEQCEALAHLCMGNLRRALDLCMQAEESLMPGMGGSDRYLEILDLRADILWFKSEYLEARQIFVQMVAKTSPTCSALYHAHALCGIAEMDILMEGEVSEIVPTLNAAKAVYIAVASTRVLLCSSVAAELHLYLGDTESARAAFLECLSKSQLLYPDLVKHLPLGSGLSGICAKKKDVVGRLQALRRLADIYVLLEDEDTALHLFQTHWMEGRRWTYTASEQSV
ncbi:hypothetical protein B0H13DRAFT_2560751 [Mycena leptocephala]|nr:hypothetical protein B0H13DRAFT_2560751 [Mycena leptocephala]